MGLFLGRLRLSILFLSLTLLFCLPADASAQQVTVTVPSVPTSTPYGAYEVLTPTPTPTYAVVNGCPQLNPEDVANLSPDYYSRCGRCFFTPVPTMPYLEYLDPPALPGFVIGTSTPTFTPTASPTPSGIWYHTFDFTVSDGGFQLTSHGYGQYVSGAGWLTTTMSSGQSLVAFRAFFRSSTIMSASVLTTGYGLGNLSVSAAGVPLVNALYTSDNYFTWSGSAAVNPGDRLVLNPSSSVTQGSYVITITRLNLVGYGDCPFPVCDSESPSSSTPTPTFTPLPNRLGGLEDVDCSVPVFVSRDNLVSFGGVALVGRDCYVVVPEFTIDVLGIDFPGVEVCFVRFTPPYVTVLGLTLGADLVLLGLVIWYVVRLLTF